MNIKEQDVPEKFRPIIRRLQAAAQVKEVMEVIELEDDFAKEMLEYEERLAKAESEKAKAESEKAKAESEKAKAESEKIKAESEKIKAESEKIKAESERDLEKKLREDAVWFMLEYGIDKKSISEKLGISFTEIDDIQRKKMN